MMALLGWSRVGEGARWKKLSLWSALERCSLSSAPLSLQFPVRLMASITQLLLGKLQQCGCRSSKPKFHGQRHQEDKPEQSFPLFKSFLSVNCERDKRLTTTDTLNFFLPSALRMSKNPKPALTLQWTRWHLQLDFLSTAVRNKPFLSRTCVISPRQAE